MLYLRLIELPFFRLDARPFDGETVTRVPQRARDIKILLIAVIVVACASGGGHFPLASCRRPVRILNAALHLIRGGRRAPEKSVGKGLHAFTVSAAEQMLYDADRHREREREKGKLETPE